MSEEEKKFVPPVGRIQCKCSNSNSMQQKLTKMSATTKQCATPLTIDLEPEGLNVEETATRKVVARPGPLIGSGLNFRGWLIDEIDPRAAQTYLLNHLHTSKGDRTHIIAAISSDTAKEGQAVGVIAFGDFKDNLDRGLVSKVFFPFTQGEDVANRELATIRHALQEGLRQIKDREGDYDRDRQGAVKVKTLTIVTTHVEAIRRIASYSGVRAPRQMKLCFRPETLLRDIADISSILAERDVTTCICYAPNDSAGPLTLAAVNASFLKELDGLTKRDH